MRPSESSNTKRRVATLIKLYELADARLSNLVNESLISGTMAKLRYRRRVLGQVRELLGDLRAEGNKGAQEVVLSAYDDGLIVAHPNEGRRAIKGALGGGPHRQAVEVLVDSLDHNLQDAEATVGRRINDIFRREQLRIISEQLATGQVRVEAAKALETALRRQGTTAFVDRRGRQWSLSTYTAMAARTVQREAMSTATKNRMLERGLDLVTIDKHPHETDACSPYDGKTFSLTGATPDYPVIDKLPPFHPKHTVFPARANFDAALRAA
jgi:hypothetical protein